MRERQRSEWKFSIDINSLSFFLSFSSCPPTLSLALFPLKALCPREVSKTTTTRHPTAVRRADRRLKGPSEFSRSRLTLRFGFLWRHSFLGNLLLSSSAMKRMILKNVKFVFLILISPITRLVLLS